jgi:hypothetical protein
VDRSSRSRPVVESRGRKESAYHQKLIENDISLIGTVSASLEGIRSIESCMSSVSAYSEVSLDRS